MAFNSTTKSSRTLQSRRYTTTGANDFNDAFTQVFDLSIAEIYDQADLLPTASLPYSGSSQAGSILKGTDGVTDIAQYYYKLQLSPVNVAESGRYTTWFTISPVTASGVRGDQLQPGQITNWVSNKYIDPSIAGNTAESAPVPGYNVYVSDGSGNLILGSKYQFDYKTGTLVFLNISDAPSSPIYLSGYRYLGRTLADNKTLGYSGSFSGSFEGDGAGLTNLPASSIVGLNLTQIADTTVSASVSAGTTSFQLISGSDALFTVNNSGNITSAGSASFKDTTVTGSLTVTQNLTVFGTASFTSVTSSELFVSGSRVLLHTNLGAGIRFGGMEVIDDTITGTTGSLLWDSQNNHWVYANPLGSTYDGAGLMSGPRNSLGLGNETYPAKYSVLRGQGGDHLEGSNVYSTGSNITINKGATGSLDGLELLGDLEVTGSVRITAGASGSFSGSFQGDGNGLTNIPADSIVGLNLTQIADSNITASVSSTGTPFRVIDGVTSLFEINNVGGITTYSTSSLQDITVTGSALVSGDIITQTSLTVSGSTILSGSFNIEGSNTITGTTGISGSTTISGSVVIISDSEVTGSVNVSGSTNTVGTSTVVGEMIVTGSLTVSGSSTLTNVGPAEFTGSTGVLGTLNVEGTSSIFGTSLVTGSTILSGSVDVEGPINSVGITTLTGSTLLSAPAAIAGTSSAVNGDYALSVSQSAWFYNHNAGVPRSNAWKDNLNGSYFNNFDSNTNVSEILRFMAGLLSASAPSPTPNTKAYGSLTETKSNTSTVSNPTGFVPQSSTNSNIIYLVNKGWAVTGSSIFNGLTIYNNSNYTVSYNSKFSGSTTISSSVDAELFGLGPLDSPVRVSGSISFRFEQANDSIATATSSSQHLIELLGVAPQTVSGVTKRKINTANSAVIPAEWQDGKFTNILPSTLYNGGIGFSNVSSSGYYDINATIGISSSLASGYNNKSITERIFWSEVTDGDFSQNTITHNPTYAPLTATSRSLSGAPYLQIATWNYQDTASGVFDPLYHEGTPIFSISSNSASVTIGGTISQVMSGGNISTTSLVYDSTGTTQRSVGTVPYETDIIKTSNTITFNAGTSDNIQQSTTLSPSLFTITALAEDRDGSNITSGSNIEYHTAGTFGQPVSSGSMAYYGQSQTYDGSSLTGTSENFSGESSRVQITDNVLSGSYTTADKFITGSYVTDNLGELDLQVKPGYLIRPGGSYKYWLPTPTYTGGRTGAGTYRYYARAFRVTNNKASLTISTTGGTLGNWYNSSTNYAVAVIFQSVWDITGNPILWDPTVNNSNAAIATGVSRDDLYNPFDTPVDIYGVGQVPSTANSIAFNDVANQFVNTTYPNFILLFRYNGDRIPLTQISITYTT